MFAKIQRIHFVGIGGIGMSGIAEVLLNLGYKISGSDLKPSAVTDRLAKMGAQIFPGHLAENVSSADVVVTSSAIVRDNPEVTEATRLHIPIIQRAEMLAELMRLKYGIAIAGMHGKTTTTSMVATVLAAGGLDPTVVVGGRVDAMGSNARLGKSQYLVAEADESDRSFLKLSPILSVVTNIDREHMDCYRDMQDVEGTFVEFMNRVPFYGMVVACADDAALRALLPRVKRRVTTYGMSADANFRVQMVPTEPSQEANRALSRFQVQYKDHQNKDHQNKDQALGEFQLHVPGRHNVLNATAAIAAGVSLDISPDHIRQALQSFRGVDRRFQHKGVVRGITVVDDYGHHPTEIRATLAAAIQAGFARVHVIFQPHRYTRTQLLMDDFAAAFGDAATIAVLDIYPASEAPIPGITAEVLAQRIRQQGKRDAQYAASFGSAITNTIASATSGDLILTLGAGNVSQLAPQVLEQLSSTS